MTGLVASVQRSPYLGRHICNALLEHRTPNPDSRRACVCAGGDVAWDTERRAALQADRAAVEAAWGEHVADNDLQSLRYRAVSAQRGATLPPTLHMLRKGRPPAQRPAL